MFDIDLAQHGILVRIAVSLGVLIVSFAAAAGMGVACMFFLAVLGDSGEMNVSAATIRRILNVAAGFMAIGILGPCVWVNIRGTLQSGIIPATIGFGGVMACLFVIMILWGADK